jgi:hypothetical protein
VPAPSRMSAYRVLVRHGLIEPGPRKRPKDSYLRWERDEPMALWQMDIVGGAFLADGTEAKIVTGVDDHSRYCVICQVVARPTGRAVCLAFAGALRAFGVPAEVLSTSGRWSASRRPRGLRSLRSSRLRNRAPLAGHQRRAARQHGHGRCGDRERAPSSADRPYQHQASQA